MCFAKKLLFKSLYFATLTQITQWDFQNKGTFTSPARLSFVLEVYCVICVPAQFIPYHVTGSCKGPIHCLCTDYENKTFINVLTGNLSALISFTLLKRANLNFEKYRLAEIVQLSTRVVIFESLDWTTSTKLSTSTIFEFQTTDISGALALHVAFRYRTWICDVIMWSLKSGIEKSYSYSLSYS